MNRLADSAWSSSVVSLGVYVFLIQNKASCLAKSLVFPTHRQNKISVPHRQAEYAWNSSQNDIVCLFILKRLKNLTMFSLQINKISLAINPDRENIVDF